MEDMLVDDVIVLIMKHLDPLSLVLFGMTSKANRERRLRPGSGRVWSAIPKAAWTAIDRSYRPKPIKFVEKKINIAALVECFGSPETYTWAEAIWPNYKSGSDRLALAGHNFPLARFLVTERGFYQLPFSSGLNEPDYSILEFMITVQAVPVRDTHYPDPEKNPVLYAWLKARDPSGPRHVPRAMANMSLIEWLRYIKEREDLPIRYYQPMVDVPRIEQGPGLISRDLN
jgi:hypothetical protein